MDNLHRSPLYSGKIEGTGPRYCPSIEDKVVRFADKERHQIFIEPMGRNTDEMYVQGMSSSLPEDVASSAFPSMWKMPLSSLLDAKYPDVLIPKDDKESLSSPTIKDLLMIVFMEEEIVPNVLSFLRSASLIFCSHFSI